MSVFVSAVLFAWRNQDSEATNELPRPITPDGVVVCVCVYRQSLFKRLESHQWLSRGEGVC